MDYFRMPYTKAEDIWLKKYYKRYGKHGVVEKFNKHFNSNRKMSSLWHRIMQLNLTGKDPDFRTKMVTKKCSVPIGTEHMSPDGYTWIKIKNEFGKKYQHSNWEQKQRVIWKEHYGEIPEGYNVGFIDGNRSNFDISNLVCVHNDYMNTLKHKGWLSDNKELVNAGVIWCQLSKLIDYSDYGSFYIDNGLNVTTRHGKGEKDEY